MFPPHTGLNEKGERIGRGKTNKQFQVVLNTRKKENVAAYQNLEAFALNSSETSDLKFGRDAQGGCIRDVSVQIMSL